MKSYLAKAQTLAWGILLLAVPFGLTYVVTEPYAITRLDIFLLPFLVLTLVNVLVGNLKLRKIQPKSFGWVLLILLAAIIWGLINTHPVSNGYGLLVNRLLLPLIFGYITYLMFVDELLTFELSSKIMLWSIALLAISSASQFFGYINYLTVGRISGPYVSPNDLARYIEVLLLVTLPWIIAQKRYWYLILWLAGLVSILGTVSYNGVATFFLGMIMLVALLPKDYLGRRIKGGLLALMMIVAIVVGVNAGSLPKYRITINDSRLSRLEYWHVAWGVIKDHPLTGIGIKSWELHYPEYLEKYGTLPPRNWSSAQPHNVFLDALLKAGIPGLLAVVTFLLWPIIAGLVFLKNNRDSKWRWFGLAIACSMAAMLLFGIIDDPIWSDDIMLLIMTLDFLLAGLLASGGIRKLEDA